MVEHNKTNKQRFINSTSFALFLFALLLLANGFHYTAQLESGDEEQEAGGPKVTYTGYTVFRALPQKEYHVDGLRKLRDKDLEGIEFWTEPNGLNKSVDIMVSPERMYDFTDTIKCLRVPVKRIMNDVGEVIKRSAQQAPVVFQRQPKMFDGDEPRGDSDDVDAEIVDDPNLLANTTFAQNSAQFYSKFQSYREIERKLQDLAGDSRVNLEVIGISSELRNIYVAKISTNPAANRPVVLIDAGHHAREWVSHSTALYLIESLISDRMPARDLKWGQETSCNPWARDRPVGPIKMKPVAKELALLLKKYDIWVVPAVNPDGYVYTHTTDRMWRKTRSRAGSFMGCVGTDPNRNYPFHWRESGASTRPCSEIYAGPRANSEPEVQTMVELMKRNKDRIAMYITLHSYSQVILIPYGYAQVEPDNMSELTRIARAGALGFGALRGTKYKYGNTVQLMYPAAGASDDYAIGAAGIKLTYAIELPDTGCRGFLLPASEIIAVGMETVNGLRAMIEAM